MTSAQNPLQQSSGSNTHIIDKTQKRAKGNKKPLALFFLCRYDAIGLLFLFYPLLSGGMSLLGSLGIPMGCLVNIGFASQSILAK